MNDFIHVERICWPVTNLGPGRRLVAWLQGCTRRCPGCMSPELFHRREESAQTVETFADSLCSFSDGDGVTISGGEPFEQVDALAAVLTAVRRRSDPEVMIYTGFQLEELRARGGACAAVLAQTDILVDGPFLAEAANTLLWRGSDNQRLHLLSERAQRHAPWIGQTYGGRRRLHFQHDGRGHLVIIGIPERGFAEQFGAAAGRRGVMVRGSEES